MTALSVQAFADLVTLVLSIVWALLLAGGIGMFLLLAARRGWISVGGSMARLVPRGVRLAEKITGTAYQEHGATDGANNAGNERRL